jgi:hypothetical protein
LLLLVLFMYELHARFGAVSYALHIDSFVGVMPWVLHSGRTAHRLYVSDLGDHNGLVGPLCSDHIRNVVIMSVGQEEIGVIISPQHMHKVVDA